VGGTVYKLDQTTGVPSILFSIGHEGAYPYAGLVRDSAGTLYGTTQGGGEFGAGTVYKLKPNGDDFTVLHAFNGSEGANPYAGLIQDSAGNLYGTTQDGGEADYYTVVKLRRNGAFDSLVDSVGCD